ncbi:hypothetical protein POPTR_002G062800v4 [Populus trichocarpa]|uniref:Uncharacterized protein n=1 Tax=Populus trichocarpa TaxID=3694 RepID=A0ACC0TCW6_POPTR|nr:uncharacterized protein LOC7468754 [Populus trichocarpa]KAI9399213.1 hypothetical protein POPTR_002G062800v4 [Populus trichocarpa]
MQTIFIALQCYQCSTMQVKQKKKSSNKWTCVVCNQKQSVRKVFAQGCLAKDLRKFVQSFNMSRKIADEQDSLDQDAVLIPTSETDHIGLNEDCQRKRRSDWTEYLDAEEEYNIKQEDEGEEPGLMVVTELPKEMFKKPRLKNDFGQNSGDHGDGNLYKPVFSKRNASKIPMSRDKESRKYQSTKPAGNSKWSDCMTQAEEEERISQPTTGKTKASKWKDYITQDEDGFNSGRGRNVGAHHQNCGDWENILDDDQKVEDDVHPDFM